MKEIYEYNQLLSKINYGWYDKSGKLYQGLSKSYNFKKNYRMQKTSNIIKNNYAICWELCELEREYFKGKYPYITVFAILKDHKKNPCHTFLIFKNKNKYYFFEASWNKYKGVHVYQSIDEILNDIKNNFSDFAGTKYNPEKISFYSYKKPFSKSTCNLFYFNALILGKRLTNKKYPI